MFSGIWAKISAGLAVIGGVLLLMLRGEKSKRKAAELEASIEKENRKNLQNAKKVVEEIQENRQKFDEEQEKNHTADIVELEKLKNEDNDSVVVDGVLSMYNQDDSKN